MSLISGVCYRHGQTNRKDQLMSSFPSLKGKEEQAEEGREKAWDSQSLLSGDSPRVCGCLRQQWLPVETITDPYGKLLWLRGSPSSLGLAGVLSPFIVALSQFLF